MPSRNPWATYKLGSLVAFLYRYRICSSSHDLSLGYNHGLWISRPLGYGSSMHQGRRLYSASSVVYRKYDEIDMLKEDNEKVQVQTSVPGKMVCRIYIVPAAAFFEEKWDNLLKLEGKLEKAAEEVVYVAEVVEKVATTTEKVSAEVADKLPGDGKLKQTALMVEHISNTAAADAQLTEHFIDKVANLKQDFEELEKMVEPVIDRIAEVKHG